MEFRLDNRRGYAATGSKHQVPERETVVFLHGTGQDHSIWVLPARYFASHRRNVLAVDLPGHGRSAGPALSSIEAMADWLARLLDTASVETAALVGHSMGSLVALETAARHRARVRAIALVGVSVPMPVNQALLGNAREDEGRARDMLTVWGHSRGAQLGGNATPGIWMLGAGRRLLARAAPGTIYTDLSACDRYVVGLDQAKEVTCPVLWILGERDVMTPAKSARAVAAALPDSRTVILEGAGHALLAERPDPVLDELIRFV
jgi:pimeloyl-ACP methyl ester carboxylesterase